MLTARRFTLTFQNPTGPLDAEVTVDERGRFAKADMPALGLSIARQDLAGVETRSRRCETRPIPRSWFPASGLRSRRHADHAPAQGRLRHPAVVLVAGSGPVERDGTVAGIPLFAQLAGQLAERGFRRPALRQARRRPERRADRNASRSTNTPRTQSPPSNGWRSARTSTRSESSSPATARGPRWRWWRRRAKRRSPALVLLAGMGIPGAI